MRIASIEVKNFKSLVDFKISLAKTSCLIGLNGAGKSTVLQFIDFMSQMVRGNLKTWFDERKWKPADIRSKLRQEINLDFTVRFENENGESAGRWEGSYSTLLGWCVRERIDLHSFLLETKEGSLEIIDLATGKGTAHQITFDYSGSVISVLKEEFLPPPLREFKKFIGNIRSLELLTPEFLRQRTRESFGTLGRGGQNLASFIHEMQQPKLHTLREKLKTVYPHLESINAKSLKSGFKQLEISELFHKTGKDNSPLITTQARHVNDGMLRLIAILAELQSQTHFLMFDEIENGINPELVEFVIDQLVNAQQQILMTTHSPMILNYLDDEVATKGVIYLYKTKAGHTRSIPFFSIPSLAEKLTMMGPGEAFVDTDLTHLRDEIELLTEAR